MISGFLSSITQDSVTLYSGERVNRFQCLQTKIEVHLCKYPTVCFMLKMGWGCKVCVRYMNKLLVCVKCLDFICIQYLQ